MNIIVEVKNMYLSRVKDLRVNTNIRNLHIPTPISGPSVFCDSKNDLACSRMWGSSQEWRIYSFIRIRHTIFICIHAHLMQTYSQD